jgi:hypothetical protein
MSAFLPGGSMAAALAVKQETLMSGWPRSNARRPGSGRAPLEIRKVK